MVYSLIDRVPPDQAPQSWAALWAEVDEILEMVRADFAKHVQSYEEAVEDAPTRGDVEETLENGSGRKVEGVLKLRERDHLIRYRKSENADQLADFRQFGLAALERVDELVDAREWTPAFAHHWSVLMFAHGFIASSMFAPEGDLQHEWAGAASRAANTREPHLRWFSHYCLRAYERLGNQGAAEDEVERLIRAILDGTVADIGGVRRDWFRFLVFYPKREKRDQREVVPSLTHRFRSKNLSLRKMRELVKLPTDDLPPLNLSFPHP